MDELGSPWAEICLFKKTKYGPFIDLAVQPIKKPSLGVYEKNFSLKLLECLEHILLVNGTIKNRGVSYVPQVSKIKLN